MHNPFAIDLTVCGGYRAVLTCDLVQLAGLLRAGRVVEQQLLPVGLGLEAAQRGGDGGARQAAQGLDQLLLVLADAHVRVDDRGVQRILVLVHVVSQAAHLGVGSNHTGQVQRLGLIARSLDRLVLRHGHRPGVRGSSSRPPHAPGQGGL
jgi:hypothetical protein